MPGSFRLFGFAVILLVVTSSTAYAIDISDLPVEATISTPPPIVMLIYDNSGSMDMEFATDQPQGLFEGAYYLFPDEAYQPKPDHFYGTGHALKQKDRLNWRSQWVGCNHIYYSPKLIYKPWPSTAKHIFDNADLNFPASRPIHNSADKTQCRMSSIFFSTNSGDEKIDVLLAHYFTHHDTNSDGRWETGEPVYLVTWTDNDKDGRLDLGESTGRDQRRYYRFADNADGLIQANELIPVLGETEKNLIRAARMSASGRFQGFLTDKEELQNFVNWFTYYRRREFIAKEAAARILSDAGRLHAGLYSVNPGARIGVRPINMPGSKSTGTSIDGVAADLMDAVYALDSKGSSPLRHALDQVGRYLHQDYHSELGLSPFNSNAAGGSCQRACTVLISDGFWNGDFSGVGNADGSSGKPYADAWADTLADIAMTYYKNDLGPNLPDSVPPTKCDQSMHQHMNTYAVSVGYPVIGDAVQGADTYEGQAPCLGADPSMEAEWVKPSAVKGVEGDQANRAKFIPNHGFSSVGVSEDLRHAALNGRGSYVDADSALVSTGIWPQMLSEQNTTACAANLAVNAISVTDDTMVFQMTYRPEDWSGEVSASLLALHSEKAASPPEEKLWLASKLLPGDSNTLWDQRRIVTYGGPWLEPQGVAFRYNRMSADQLTVLGSDLNPKSSTDAQAREIIDYIRGKSDSKYRHRETLLGDITHSTPALFGRTLFVGANDGMLHAFDTQSGAERFAYVPALVYDHLKALADDHYADRHRCYVDGPLYVGEVMVGDHCRQAYLLGGLGKGGKGYFCLSVGRRERSMGAGGYDSYHWINHVDDIADGSQEEQVAGLVRWEYPRPDPSNDWMDNDADAIVDEPAEDDPNIGYSFSQAYAVNANCSEKAYRPVVIFGNGYSSESQKAVLYVLDAGTGKVIRMIDTGSYGDNGLSTPALIDVDLDRRVDYAYAGDLKGNLWKFDLTAEDPLRWGVAFGNDMNGDGVIDAARGDLPAPLFQAPGQPITGRPDVMVMHGGCLSQAPGFMVFFGTGKYLGVSDRQDPTQQSLYGIWDFGDDSDDSENLGAIEDRPSGRLSSGLFLFPKRIVGETSIDGKIYRRVSSDHIGYELVEDLEDADGCAGNNSSEMKKKNPRHYAGWFLDFPPPAESSNASAERVVGDVLVRRGNIIVPSYVPDNQPCGGGGRSWLNLFAACSADPPLESSGEPLLSIGYDGSISSRPEILKHADDPAKDLILLADHAGQIQIMEVTGENWGRVYWRQSR